MGTGGTLSVPPFEGDADEGRTAIGQSLGGVDDKNAVFARTSSDSQVPYPSFTRKKHASTAHLCHLSPRAPSATRSRQAPVTLSPRPLSPTRKSAPRRTASRYSASSSSGRRSAPPLPSDEKSTGSQASSD